MCYCKDRFFERLSLASLLHVVDPEGGIMMDNTVCHQPDHSPEVPITRFDILLSPSDLPD
jgi:hypothetical protein